MTFFKNTVHIHCILRHRRVALCNIFMYIYISQTTSQTPEFGRKKSQDTGSDKPKLQPGNRSNVLGWNCSLVLSVSWESTSTWSCTIHMFRSTLSVFVVQAVIQSSPPCWNTAGKSRLAVVWSAAGGRLPRCCLDTLLPASSRQPEDTHIKIALYANTLNCNCAHVWLNKNK